MKLESDRKLALSDWAELAEILAGIAVVLSLIYVGVQVRQNTQAIEIAAAQQSHDAYRQAQIAIMEEPTMAVALEKAYSNQQLSPVEALQVETYIHFIFSNWELAYLNHEKRLLDNEIWVAWERYYIWLMSYDNFKKSWIDNPVDGYTRSFTDYIDSTVLPKIANIKE
jgi:hypothetical protein